MNTHNNNSVSLETQKIDYIAIALKATLGSVPYAGSLLSELIGTIIPNQRLDRLTKFAKSLETKISQIEKKFAQSQLKDDNFSDLLEEGFRQAARSLSDERREYIASIIANSLSSQDIEYMESKHLLRILDEINDVEVIWLRFYVVSTMGGDKEFREKHQDIIKPITRVMGTPQPVRDKGTLQDSYKHHLERLGLLKHDGKSYSLLPLGNLMLREIGLIKKEDKA
ncbi:MAG: hypothetical protein NUV74_19175 [Candidatus Brocadiaceae bacterium]|nr:hypothetical protein [Candidatus Brocadiaceae bacterium]